MSPAVLWIGEADDTLREAFANRGLRLDVADTITQASLRVASAEPAYSIFARWSDAVGQLIRQWRQAGRDMTVLVGIEPEAAQSRLALESGATDYLLRPFTAAAAITRLQTHANRRPPPALLLLGDRQVDLELRQVVRPAETETLTEIEARLLAFLGAHLEQPVRTETVLRQVWGYSMALRTRAVANTVMRLRRKIEIDPKQPRHLLTVRGVGYRLVASVANAHALPEPAGGLIGRDHLLLQAQAALENGGVLLHGPPGVGKSRLAHTLAHRHPGTAQRLQLDGVTTPAQLLHLMAVKLTITLQAEMGLSALGAVLASRGPSLLWFDGADAVLPALAQALQAWPIGAPRIVVTAQASVPCDRLSALRVGPLETADGLALLRTEGRAAGADLDYSTDEARRLADTLDGLPMAIMLAARLLPVLTFEQVAARMAGLTQKKALGSSLEGAWQALSPAARRVLWVAAQLPGAFGVDLLERMADLGDQVWLPDLLGELLRRSLVEQDPSAPVQARFRLLTCVRLWVQTRSPDGLDHAGVERRVTRHLLSACESAAADLLGRAPQLAVTRLERLLPAMQALAAHAEPTVRLRALLAKGELLHFRGMLVGHHVELLEQVPSTDAALDERARIQAAQFLLALGRFDAARAQLDAVQAGSLWARVQAERAEIAVGEGDFARAAQMASAGAARAPSDFLRGRLLDLEATARHHLGENVAELQNRALAALRRAGAHWYEAIVRHNLAFDYLEQGALDDALAGFEAFANVARRVSSVLYIAMIEHNIARVLLERGALADAEQNARSALARMRDTDYRRGEALTLMGLGLILVEQAQAERARHCLREAQAVAELYGVGRVERQAQLWLAVLDHHAGRLAEAQRRYTALRDAFGSDAERDQVLLSEVAALLALERGEPVAPLSLHPRDAARSKWSGALIAAAQARDWQALDALGADPIMSRSFQARLLHTLALRMTSTAG